MSMRFMKEILRSVEEYAVRQAYRGFDRKSNKMPSHPPERTESSSN
jgi:hypothetical protein